MKRKTINLVLCVLVCLSVFSYCTPEEESPTPQTKPPVNNQPPVQNPPADTLALFADKQWTIQKVHIDGVEQSSHWLKGCSYGINKTGDYFFNIPGFPSASGTWSFDASGKNKVNFQAMGTTKQWTILTLNTNKLVVNEPQSNGKILKLEFSN